MLNSYQQSLFASVVAKGLIEAEQAELKDECVCIPVVGGFIEVSIPRGEWDQVWIVPRVEGCEGASFRDLKRAMRLGECLAEHHEIERLAIMAGTEEKAMAYTTAKDAGRICPVCDEPIRQGQSIRVSYPSPTRHSVCPRDMRPVEMIGLDPSEA